MTEKNIEELAKYGEKAIERELKQRLAKMQIFHKNFKEKDNLTTRMDYIVGIADYEAMRDYALRLGVMPSYINVNLESWKKVIPNLNEEKYKKLLEFAEIRVK